MVIPPRPRHCNAIICFGVSGIDIMGLISNVGSRWADENMTLVSLLFFLLFLFFFLFAASRRGLITINYTQPRSTAHRAGCRRDTVSQSCSDDDVAGLRDWADDSSSFPSRTCFAVLFRLPALTNRPAFEPSVSLIFTNLRRVLLPVVLPLSSRVVG